MLRLPRFRYLAPRTVEQAARMLRDEGPDAVLLAGGTDLVPKKKQRQCAPRTVIGLGAIDALAASRQEEDVLVLGAGLPIARLERLVDPRGPAAGLWQAASQIATVQIRNQATLGGNLCLARRCAYYDQSLPWRRAVGFCLRDQGSVCWGATGSQQCLAVSATDLAPVLVALGATVQLVCDQGARELPLEELYADSGDGGLLIRSDEILTRARVPVAGDWRSTYWKLRRRGAIDFPEVSVAAAAQFAGDHAVRQLRLVLGAVVCRPLRLPAAESLLADEQLSDQAIAAAADAAARIAQPVGNTDLEAGWRKKIVRQLVIYALRQLRGDDMRSIRRRYGQRTV